jgi:type IV secretory pathway VirB10-like protein
LSTSPADDISSKKGARALLVGGALLVVALVVWLLSGTDKVPEPTGAETTEEAPADEPERQAEPARAPTPAPTASVTRTVATAAPSAEEFPPSHPITEERQRLQRQNQYVQMMNDAMDLKDGPRLRELAKRFNDEGFVDTDKHGEGYLLVADCLERPSEASRAAAQAFWDRELGSNLRRFVKRHCLE